MRGFWKHITPLLVLGAVLIVPTPVFAETMSVTQIITVTARVAPMRSIVVNEQGRITKIYSNTDEPVQPKVYLNEAPGSVRQLTPQLLAQYNKIIAQQKNLVGVEIPVEPPQADNNSVRDILINSVSTFTSHLKL